MRYKKNNVRAVPQEVQHGTETENFQRTVPLLTELLLASHEDQEVLADASTNVTIPGAAPAPAPPATVPVGSATARYRNRKKPPRWLQAKQSKAKQAVSLTRTTS